METFKSSILAGLAISLGCTVFLSIGGLWGAVLFSFGLLTVVHYRLKLYTGTAGFTNDLKELGLILVGNIVGCFITSLAIRYSSPTLCETAGIILGKRLSLDLVQGILLGAGCGFIMTTAVQFAREEKFLPLLFGVPLFIMCGFLHSIADAFYYLMAPLELLEERWLDVILIYLSIVLGNYVGCNIYRAMMNSSKKVEHN